MLQQTQLAVALYWTRWMAVFPSLEMLAAASLDELAGGRVSAITPGSAGCMRRRSCCGTTVARALEGWMALPGIGRTTAGSILSSGFNLRLPILDGNVKRVLAD